MRKFVCDYRSPPSGLGTIFREDGNEISLPYPPSYYEDGSAGEEWLDWEEARLREYGVTHIIDTEYGNNFESGNHPFDDLWTPIPLEDWLATVRKVVSR